MPLTFACPCGQQLEVDDQYAGMPVSCPTCNGVTNAPARRRAVAIAVAPPPRPTGSKGADPGFEVVEDRPRKQRARLADDDEDEDRPRRRRRDEDDDEDERPRRKRLNRSQEKPKGRSLEGRVFNGGMMGGALAMLIAVVWFVVGLLAGWVFFYPPILFVIGLVGFIKGMVARNDD
jgi:hypothetical protein